MNKKPYRLICCDLDGTLLDRSGHVSRENLEAIRALTERGVIFAPSSGRCFGEMPKEVTEIPHVRYIIQSDGAVIYDKKEKRRHTACMDREQMRFLLSVLADYETLSSTRVMGEAYQDAKKATREQYFYHKASIHYANFLERHIPRVEDFARFCADAEETEMVCTFFHSEKEQEECKARLLKMGFEVASSEPHNLEIFHKSAGKGNALLRLASLLGIPTEETVSLGDTLNDISHIKAAGLGIAMGNAMDEVKAVADAVICRNDEHAIRYLLENYF